MSILMKYLIMILLICTISNSYAGLNYQEYLEVKIALEKAFLDIRPDDTHTLEINKPVGEDQFYWFNLDMVHASYSGYEADGKNFHHVFLFGGFIRLQEMTKDGLALTGCHEIGHGLGGFPKKTSGSSTEGQSDYFSTKDCLEVVFKYLPLDKEIPSDDYEIKFCQKYSANFNYCLRAFNALKSDIYFFETLGDYTRVDSYALEVAVDLNTDPSFYPSAQCRIDTMIHGIIDIERPICWFPKGIERKL